MAHEPQAAGRTAESRVRVYSSMLDGKTCSACAALAGLEYAVSDPHAPIIPNPECTRPEGCRCSWI